MPAVAPVLRPPSSSPSPGVGSGVWDAVSEGLPVVGDVAAGVLSLDSEDV